MRRRQGFRPQPPAVAGGRRIVAADYVDADEDPVQPEGKLASTDETGLADALAATTAALTAERAERAAAERAAAAAKLEASRALEAVAQAEQAIQRLVEEEEGHQQAQRVVQARQAVQSEQPEQPRQAAAAADGPGAANRRSTSPVSASWGLSPVAREPLGPRRTAVVEVEGGQPWLGGAPGLPNMALDEVFSGAGQLGATRSEFISPLCFPKITTGVCARRRASQAGRAAGWPRPWSSGPGRLAPRSTRST